MDDDSKRPSLKFDTMLLGGIELRGEATLWP